ncbi:hypothetical protein B0H99_105106 [Planomicrobium soli]|uniref:Uncharacterized protein n=1 Tax=Planomicrobium soli TaxID=1176648 RepID=A0A2P8H288_9BACL|nr:hypothetical protein [Planomicrobium soli]PSL40329.1 hypothetical protein B0H99_105106 [Planomicrobium soli]
MEMIMDNKRLPLIICVTLVLGFSCASLSARYEFLYLMVTALIIEVFIFDEDRKLNMWKYFAANLLLLFSIFSLFTFM